MTTKLPFTQGYEVELQLVNAKGEILAGEMLLDSWEEMFNKAADLLKNIKSKAPGDIANKIKSVEVKNKDRHGKQIKYVTIGYDLGGKTIEVDAFGPDPNISQITWILELVTPPCEEMEELGWWLTTLYAIAVQSVPGDVKIHSIGFNGMETEYRSGVTFGDHIHIGVPDEGRRVKVYNMLRAFVPHLIAITVNSPFINEMPVGAVIVKKEAQLQVLPKESTRSIRLHYNKGQMGPPDKDHYIPYLASYDQKAFDRVVARGPPDDRYVDMFPFTNYGTIELRFFDAQFSVARRLAITALIQSLAYYATQKSSNIPNVKPEILISNREKAVEYGLVGKFFPDETLDASIASFYNLCALTGKKNAKLFQAVQSLVYQLWNIITELHFENFLQPLLVSAFGTESLVPPLTPADYLLYKYKTGGEKYSKLLADLTYFTENCCTVLDKDPIVEEFGRVNPQKVFASAVSGEPTNTQEAVSGSTGQPPTEMTVRPVISYSGELKLGTKELYPEILLPFEADLQTTGDLVGEGTVVLKIVEVIKGTERVVQTSIKKVPLGPNIFLSSKDVALELPYGVFQGNKQCQISLELKDEKGILLYKTQAGPLLVWGTPEINVKIVGGLNKQIQPDSEHEFTVSVTNKTPKFGGEHKLKLLVLDSLKQPLFSGEKDFKLTSQSTHKFIIFFDHQTIRADFVTLRVQVLNADKILSEYESSNVEILREPEEILPQTQKPKVQVQVTIPKPITAPPPSASGIVTSISKKIGVPRPRVSPPQVTIKSKGKSTTQPLSYTSSQGRTKQQVQIKSKTSKGQTFSPRPKEKNKLKTNPSRTQPPKPVSAPSTIKGKISPQVMQKPTPPTPSMLGKKQKVKPRIPEPKGSKNQGVQPKKLESKKQLPKVTPSPRPPVKMQGGTPLTTKSVVPKLTVSIEGGKGSYFLGDTVKVTFNLDKPGSSKSLRNLSYRSYFIANNGRNYLVKAGTVSLNTAKKINVGFKIGKPLPLTDVFKLGIIVEHNDQVIGQFTTEPIAVENKNIESLIRVTKVTNISNQIFSNGYLVPILTFQTSNVVSPTPLVIHLSLEGNEGKIFCNSLTTVEVHETNTHYIPASIKCENVPPDVSNVLFRVQVEIKGGNFLYEKRFKIPYSRFESDLTFLQLGPKAPEVAVGEEIPTLCSINNPSEYAYRGKIDLWFYPQKFPPIKFYSHKLRILAKDRYDFVQRLPAPLTILGNAVQVLADMQVSAKTKKASFRQFHLGDTVFRVTVPKRLPLNVAIRTPNSNNRATSGEVLPVQVEVKANLDLPTMRFNLLESFENIKVKKIGGGKVKKKQPIQVYNFHWKVPKKDGVCGLDVEIFENDKPIDPRLINYKQVSYIIAK